MKINLFKVLCFTLIFSSFSVISKGDGKYSVEFDKCLIVSIDNPMSTSCIENELSIQSEIIKKTLSNHKNMISPENGESVDLVSYYQSQRKVIESRCGLWLKVGGQNGMLLEQQCLLDETISLKKIIIGFIDAIDG